MTNTRVQTDVHTDCCELKQLLQSRKFNTKLPNASNYWYLDFFPCNKPRGNVNTIQALCNKQDNFK